MSTEIETRLAVLQTMNSTLGEITNTQARLTLAGKKDLAEQMDQKRKALLKSIKTLQGKVADQWTVETRSLEENLRLANTEVQTRIKNIKNEVDVANNAIHLIGKLDGAIAFLKSVV